MKMMDSSPKASKTLWDKEKLFVTSNFSFAPRVFKRLVPHTLKSKVLLEKGLIQEKRYIEKQYFPVLIMFSAHTKTNLSV